MGCSQIYDKIQEIQHFELAVALVYGDFSAIHESMNWKIQYDLRFEK